MHVCMPIHGAINNWCDLDFALLYFCCFLMALAGDAMDGCDPSEETCHQIQPKKTNQGNDNCII